MGCIASALQFIVAGYALRLNRRYGTSRVGWSLFGAFSLLALLQLVQSTSYFNAGTDAVLKVNVTYVLISFLLLTGMVHLEAMLKEQLRRERAEHQLRADLEVEVKSKTAHLTRAIEELMREMEETKRMGAIIETSHWTRIDKVAEDLAATTVADEPDPEAVGKAGMMHALAGCNGESEQFVDSILGGEWLAHF
jgi:dihydroneopterin aldolase